MICVTIGRGRHSSLAEEWKAAAEAGVELVELRLDCLLRDPNLTRILKERHPPLVVTIRREADGGLWRGTEEKRQALLREAIALGIDYVDLEMDIAPKIRRFGKTKRIVSYHNLKTTPLEIKDIAEQCHESDADIVKIAARAESVTEASWILQLGKNATVPTIPIAMGAIGVFTRVLGTKFGAPFTYAHFNPESVFAPGMMSYNVLKRDYCHDQIDQDTEVYAVIGDPIDQSLSPALHNPSFRHLGLNKVMVPLLILAEALQVSLKQLEWLGIKGMSVTIPHKEEIVALLHEKDEAVERIGACNTVVIRDGNWSGYNTDYQAALTALEAALGGTTEDGVSPLLDKQATILGAGGVARAVAFGLQSRGAIVTITNRHEERASKLAEEVGARSVPWSLRASLRPQVLINCTPVGMHPDVDVTPMLPGGFNRVGMVVFDTIYHPENTMFLKLARERECNTVTGVDMFVNQAAAQFKLYTGHDAPLDVMRANLKRKLGPLRE